jgi:hypothetical protein
MKPISAVRCLLGLFLFLAADAMQAQKSTPAEATAIGLARITDITIGEGYVTGTESIEARITVLEVVRGGKAYDLMRTASSSNPPPASGVEYICARIRFEFGAKGASGDLSYGIRAEQFASVSDNGRQYERPSVVPPKPELGGRLYPGDSLEGWIALVVSVEDKKPLMTFGNNYNRIWFRLY